MPGTPRLGDATNQHLCQPGDGTAQQNQELHCSDSARVTAWHFSARYCGGWNKTRGREYVPICNDYNQDLPTQWALHLTATQKASHLALCDVLTTWTWEQHTRRSGRKDNPLALFLYWFYFIYKCVYCHLGLSVPWNKMFPWHQVECKVYCIKSQILKLQWTKPPSKWNGKVILVCFFVN